MKTDYTTLSIIRDIIVKEMDLDNSRVNIYNQNWKIPKDDGLFVLIEAKGIPKVISNHNKTIPAADSFTEVQGVNTQEQIAVVLFSRNMDAYTRAPEVSMAIASIYSQQKQEQHSFKIARIAPAVDLSGLEGAAMLYRIEVSLIVFGWYEKTKAGDYFDTFRAELSTETETVEILPLT